MCYMAIAALALTAAGTYASYEGQKQSQSAENDAVNAAAQKQKGLDAQSSAVLQQSIQHAEQPNQQQLMAQAAQNRAQTYQQASQAAMSGLSLPGSVGATSTPPKDQTIGDRTVSDAYKTQAGKIGDFLTQQGNAKSQIDAFTDTQLGNALYNQNQSYKTQILSNFMGGNQQVLPYQLGAAANAGNDTKTIGAGLTAAGSIAGSAAATGYGSAAPKVAKSAPKKAPSQGIGSWLSNSSGYQN